MIEMGLFSFLKALFFPAKADAVGAQRIPLEAFEDMRVKFGLDYEIHVVTITGSSGSVQRLFSNGDVAYRTKLDRMVIVQYHDITEVRYTPPVDTNGHAV
jgi:hypothetical protein